MTMGSTCCKTYESPYSPKLPDFNKLYMLCAEQIHGCMKDTQQPTKPEPPVRKFSASDISGPLPLGMTRPKPPARKRRCKITRCKSLIMPAREPAKLKRSNSIHEIYYIDDDEDVPDYSPPCDLYTSLPPLPTVIEEEETVEVNHGHLMSEIQISKMKIAEERIFNDETPPLSLTPDISESKRNFLAGLLAEENNNVLVQTQPTRRPSITDSLREFENSLYDMLEEESTKTDYDERNWRPQIPVMSYH